MKKMIVCIVLCLLTGCSGPYAVTGGGGGNGDAMVSAGKVVNDNVEVGITAISYRVASNHDTYAVGPYAAYLVKDPLPEEIVEDWQIFAGGAILVSVDDGEYEPFPQLFGGVIYKPHDVLSPLYLAEKQFPSGAVNSDDIKDRGEDVYHWFALRYRF